MRRFGIIALALTLVGGALGAWYSGRQEAIYRAEATVTIRAADANIEAERQAAAELADDLLTAEMKTEIIADNDGLVVRVDSADPEFATTGATLVAQAYADDSTVAELANLPDAPTEPLTKSWQLPVFGGAAAGFFAAILAGSAMSREPKPVVWAPPERAPDVPQDVEIDTQTSAVDGAVPAADSPLTNAATTLESQRPDLGHDLVPSGFSFPSTKADAQVSAEPHEPAPAVSAAPPLRAAVPSASTPAALPEPNEAATPDPSLRHLYDEAAWAPPATGAPSSDPEPDPSAISPFAAAATPAETAPTRSETAATLRAEDLKVQVDFLDNEVDRYVRRLEHLELTHRGERARQITEHDTALDEMRRQHRAELEQLHHHYRDLLAEQQIAHDRELSETTTSNAEAIEQLQRGLEERLNQERARRDTEIEAARRRISDEARDDERAAHRSEQSELDQQLRHADELQGQVRRMRRQLEQARADLSQARGEQRRAQRNLMRIDKSRGQRISALEREVAAQDQRHEQERRRFAAAMSEVLERSAAMAKDMDQAHRDAITAQADAAQRTQDETHANYQALLTESEQRIRNALLRESELEAAIAELRSAGNGHPATR